MAVSPYPAPSWVPRLRLSLDDSSWAKIVALAGGASPVLPQQMSFTGEITQPGAILTSPAFLGPGSPIDPRDPSKGTSSWQYEGDFFHTLEQLGIDLRPGALYLGILAGTVKIRLVDPGPVTYLALPDLSQSRLTALAATLNALVP